MEGSTGIENSPKIAVEGNREHVSKVISLLGNNQAVFIEGGVHSGKTTLAKNTAIKLAEHADVHPETPISVYFTSAEVQQTFGAKPVTDRTGVTYDKVPFYRQLNDTKGTNLIVIDEASLREPIPGNWERYLQSPNNKFLVLLHPNRPNNTKWQELFHADPGALIKL